MMKSAFMALGASQRAVTPMVVKQGLVLAAIGVALGLLGALGITRFLSSLPVQVRVPLLFDVPPSDPLTLACVCAVLVSVALLACYLPARRASRVDPITALRCQ
jgi:ABC-type lipoprotein release transport system permease subunit